MLKIGHRGACGTAPENTITAFRKALELGADGVELDLHRLKNGELAVIHDDTVDRTTNGKGRVAQMTLEQIRNLHIAGGEHVPLLGKVLDMLNGAYCFIEIKDPDAALPVAEEIMRRTAEGYPPDRLWLISFHHDALARALAVHSKLPIGASFSEVDASCARTAHALGAKAILPHHRLWTTAHMQEAHALGLKVICWTANTPADIARLKEMGADGIISDYPERL